MQSLARDFLLEVPIVSAGTRSTLQAALTIEIFAVLDRMEEERTAGVGKKAGLDREEEKKRC